MPTKVQKPVIVLDAGGVLVEYDVAVVYDQLARRYHRSVKPYSPVDLDAIFAPLQIGKGSLHDILPQLNRKLGISLSPEAWKDLWCSIIIGEMPDMRKALSGLKAEFHLVALSNTLEIHWKYLLKTYPIFDLLDGWVVSYREGLAKPDPAIYKRLQARYCRSRIPFFFTDDTPFNVEAARQLGWPAREFRNASDFLAAIKALKT